MTWLVYDTALLKERKLLSERDFILLCMLIGEEPESLVVG